ncbi:MAG: hypothetical protein JXA71_09165 [Chitinispirillaceae bacterium]|nr:hypothetical protein [Chitinispirillaceae bacterium]
MVSEEIRGMIPDYVRGLLTPEEADEVRNALDAFPQLAAEYESALRYYAVVDQLQGSTAPPGFLDRVNQGIDRKPLLQRVGDLLFRPFWIKIPVEFAGLAACLIAIVVILKPQFPTNVPDEEQALALSRRPEPAALQGMEIPDVEKTTVKRLPASRPGKTAGAAPKKAPETAPSPASTPSPLSEATIATSVIAPDKTAAAPVQAIPADVSRPPPPGMKPAGPAEKPASIAAVDIGSIELAYAPVPSAELRLQKRAMRAEQGAAMGGKSGDSDGILHESAPPSALSAFRADSADHQASISVSEILDSILVKYDPLFAVSEHNGKTSYTLILSPDQLSSLSKELQQSFRIASRLLPFDPLVANKIKVTFTVKE